MIKYDRSSLSQNVIAVVIVLVIANRVVYFVFGPEKFSRILKYSLGFLVGMLAMYIAVHIYKWH